MSDIRLNGLLIDPASIGSVALRRIVEEVRNPVSHGAYDRVHNRHNRSGPAWVPPPPPRRFYPEPPPSREKPSPVEAPSDQAKECA